MDKKVLQDVFLKISNAQVDKRHAEDVIAEGKKELVKNVYDSVMTRGGHHKLITECYSLDSDLVDGMSYELTMYYVQSYITQVYKIDVMNIEL